MCFKKLLVATLAVCSAICMAPQTLNAQQTMNNDAQASQTVATVPQISPGPSMKETEILIKRELKVIGSDHILTRSSVGIWGDKYSIEDAALSDCRLTMRQVSQHEMQLNGIVHTAPNVQSNTSIVPMKDVNVSRINVTEAYVAPNTTNSKASYMVYLSALPGRDLFLDESIGYAGGPAKRSVPSIRVRVRDQTEANQLADAFRRAAVLCGAPDRPINVVPAESTQKPQSPPSKSESPATSMMTNNEVIQLVTASLSEQVIITSIRQAPTKTFDLSPTGLLALKKAGVTDAVILVMQNDTPVPPPAIEAKGPPKYDATIAEPPKPAPAPDNGCSDIDYLGVIQAVTGGGMMAGSNAYGGRVRNRAPYTKEVDFAWVMNGRAETGTFRVPAGQFIDVNLGVGSGPPTNVRVVTCR